jgi:hypothetical protein
LLSKESNSDEKNGNDDELYQYYNQEFESDTESSLFSSDSSSTESSMDMHKFKQQLRELNAEMERNGMPWEKVNTDFDSDVEFHDTENDPILDTPYKQFLYDLINGEVRKTKGSTLNFDLYLTLDDIHQAKDRTIIVKRKTSPYNYEPYSFSIRIRRNMYDGEQIQVEHAGHFVDEYGLITRESGMCVVHIHIVTHEIFTKIGSNLYATFEISLTEAKNGFKRMLKDLDGNMHEINVSKLERSDYMYVLRGVGIKKFDGFRGDIFVNFAVRLANKKEPISTEPLLKINPNRKPIVQKNVSIKKNHRFLGKKSDESSEENIDTCVKKSLEIKDDPKNKLDKSPTLPTSPTSAKSSKPKKGRPLKTTKKVSSSQSDEKPKKKQIKIPKKSKKDDNKN